MTTIDLGECETLLREFYNISKNEILYMKKIDIFQEGMKMPKIEYDVYSKLSGNKLEKLNLSVCSNSKISLSVPVEISESLDKLKFPIFLIFMKFSHNLVLLIFISAKDEDDSLTLQEQFAFLVL